MAQIFSKRFVLLSKALIAITLMSVAYIAIAYRVNARSDAPLQSAVEQPVPFSHQHHVRDDGLDCRYCHVSVETSAFAGIPPLSTCMTCHSQLFTDQAPFAPLVTAYNQGGELSWSRVYDLPDFVYFDHSIHVAKGVGCSSCHGDVSTMPLMRRVVSLDMQWCLGCHRDPAAALRPRAEIFNTHWTPPADQNLQGPLLMQAYGIRGTRELTDCSTCHR